MRVITLFIQEVVSQVAIHTQILESYLIRQQLLINIPQVLLILQERIQFRTRIQELQILVGHLQQRVRIFSEELLIQQVPVILSSGVSKLEDIKNACASVFDSYQVEFCYLFGSYAKGKATEVSDVDLLISTETTGLRFFEMTERLRKGLHKKVDVLDLKQLVNNEALIREVLREGVRIYRSDS